MCLIGQKMLRRRNFCCRLPLQLLQLLPLVLFGAAFGIVAGDGSYWVGWILAMLSAFGMDSFLHLVLPPLLWQLPGYGVVYASSALADVNREYRQYAIPDDRAPPRKPGMPGHGDDEGAAGDTSVEDAAAGITPIMTWTEQEEAGLSQRNAAGKVLPASWASPEEVAYFTSPPTFFGSGSEGLDVPIMSRILTFLRGLLSRTEAAVTNNTTLTPPEVAPEVVDESFVGRIRRCIQTAYDEHPIVRFVRWVSSIISSLLSRVAAAVLGRPAAEPATPGGKDAESTKADAAAAAAAAAEEPHPPRRGSAKLASTIFRDETAPPASLAGALGAAAEKARASVQMSSSTNVALVASAKLPSAKSSGTSGSTLTWVVPSAAGDTVLIVAPHDVVC